ncbi:CHAT domain-containing protein [Nocardia sp. NPDC004340]
MSVEKLKSILAVVFKRGGYCSGVEVQCPSCGAGFSAQPVVVVDTTVDRDARERLMAGELDVISCPACGYKGQLQAAYLYFQPDLKITAVVLGHLADAPEGTHYELAQALLQQLAITRKLSDSEQPAGLVQIVADTAALASLATRQEATLVRTLSELVGQAISAPEPRRATIIAEARAPDRWLAAIAQIVAEQADEPERATAAFDLAVAAARRTGDRLLMLPALQSAGFHYADQRDFPKAVALHSEAADLAAAENLIGQQAFLLSRVGLHQEDLGLLDEAVMTFTHSAGLFVQVGKLRGAALQHSSIGQIDVERGDPGTAMLALDSARQMAEACADDEILSQIQGWRSAALSRLGRVDEAAEALGDAIAACHRADAPERAWWALSFAGAELATAGAPQKYIEMLGTETDLAQRREAWADAAHGADILAELALRAGDLPTAARWIAQLHALAQAVSHTPDLDANDETEIAVRLVSLADRLKAEGEHDQAIPLLTAARAHFHTARRPSEATIPLLRRALWSLQDHDFADAENWAELAAGELHAAGDTLGTGAAQVMAAQARTAGMPTEDAVAVFTALAESATAADHLDTAAAALMACGDIHGEAGAHAEASQSFVAAARSFTEPALQAAAIYRAAGYLRDSGETEDALDAFAEAAELAHAAGEKHIELLAAGQLGIELRARDRDASAAQWLARAARLSVDPALSDPPVTKSIWFGIGRSDRLSRLRHRAVIHLEMLRNRVTLRDEVAPAIEVALSSQGAADIETQVGIAVTAADYLFTSTGDLERAFELLDGAVTLADRTDLTRCQISSRVARADVALQMGRTDQAHADATAAAQAAEAVGDRQLLVGAALTAAIVNNAVGEPADADRYIAIAESAARESGNQSVIAEVLSAYTLILHARGELQRALDVSAEGIELAIAANSYSAEKSVLHNRAGVMIWLGRYDEAELLYQRAGDIADANGDQYAVAGALGNLALVYLHQGWTERARENATTALNLHREMGAHRRVPTDLLSLGNIALQDGDLASAEGLLQQAFESASALRLHDTAAAAEASLATVRVDTDPASAVAILSRVLDRKSSNYSRGAELAALSNRARAYQQLGDAGGAYADAVAAVQLHERDRDALVLTHHQRARARHTATVAYDVLVWAAARSDDPAKLLEAIERTKVNSLVRRLGRVPFLSASDVPEELAEAEAALLAQLNMLDAQIDAAKTIQQRQQLDIAAGVAAQHLLSLTDRIAATTPEHERLARTVPDPTAAITALTPEGTMLVSLYHGGGEVIVAGAKGRGGEAPLMVAHHVPLSRAEIAVLLEDPASEHTAAVLGEVLAPVVRALTPFTYCYLAPHGALFQLPLIAATIDGHPLLAYAPVMTIPSAIAAAGAATRPRSRAHNVVVAGYTGDETERELFEGEAAAVAALLGVPAVLGAHVTVARVVSGLGDARVVHLSCHGWFEADDPLASGLELADGILTARELLDVACDAELVTVSACETAVAVDTGVNELVGLTQALLAAGARATLTSLWQVPATPTHRLMTLLYQHLARGESVAEAFRHAVLTVRAERPDHPAWAGFVLTGGSSQLPR